MQIKNKVIFLTRHSCWKHEEEVAATPLLLQMGLNSSGTLWVSGTHCPGPSALVAQETPGEVV